MDYRSLFAAGILLALVNCIHLTWATPTFKKSQAAVVATHPTYVQQHPAPPPPRQVVYVHPQPVQVQHPAPPPRQVVVQVQPVKVHPQPQPIKVQPVIVKPIILKPVIKPVPVKPVVVHPVVVKPVHGKPKKHH